MTSIIISISYIYNFSEFQDSGLRIAYTAFHSNGKLQVVHFFLHSENFVWYKNKFSYLFVCVGYCCIGWLQLDIKKLPHFERTMESWTLNLLKHTYANGMVDMWYNNENPSTIQSVSWNVWKL